MKKRRTRWKKVRILAAKKQALRRKKEIFVTLIILHVVEMFCLQWKVHLVHQLQAPHSNNLKQVIQTEHKRIKNPTGRRQPWLLTSAAEDLNSGQPRTNPASRQSGSRTAALVSVVINNYIIQQWYKSICRIINHNFQDKLKLLLAFFSLMFQSMKILPAPGMFTSNAINGF